MEKFFVVIVYLLYVPKRIIRKAMLFFYRCYSVGYLLAKHTKFKDIKTVKFNGKCLLEVDKNSDFSIGRSFTCNSGDYAIDTLTRSKIRVGCDASLYIGDYSGMSNSVINCSNKIVIGNHVNIGAGCMIFDSNFHSVNWEKRGHWKTDADDIVTSPVTIKDYAFIGARSIILKGVTIGERSIIAAGGVVNKDIPDDCIAGGNPCRIIKVLC